MEIRVEDRRPVGRPRRTWFENVKADMAELEIDREDIHGRKKWRVNDIVNIPAVFIFIFSLLLFIFLFSNGSKFPTKTIMNTNFEI